MNGYGAHAITDPLELYSLSDEIIAHRFRVDQSGYIIINTINYDIMEFSFSDARALNSNCKIIYNGCLSLYEDIGFGFLVDADTRQLISSPKVESGFVDSKQIERISLENKLKQMENLRAMEEAKDCTFEKKTMQKSSFYENGNLFHSLVTWHPLYYCQVNSAAILLKYLYDYKWTRFLPVGYTQNSAVHQYLCDHRYLANKAMMSSKVVYGGEIWRQQYNGSQLEIIYTTGMNQYLTDRGITSWRAYFERYSFNRIKTLINSDLPVVHATQGYVPGATWSSAHAYVIHGYSVGYDGVPFLKVNDVHGQNNVTINASEIYHPTDYDGIWYISQ